MNPLTNKFLQRQIRENAVYFIISVGLVVSFIVSILIFFAKKSENEISKQALQKDINDLQLKVNFISNEAKIQSEGIDIDAMNALLSKLVPEKEDYFSIIDTFDRLSQSTGFIITSYSLDLTKSTKDKLSIAVEGTGDQNAFLNFLNNYSYGGGRLITVDSIDYQSQGFFKITLAVNLYSGKAVPVNESSRIDFTDNDRVLLQGIKEKTSEELIPVSDQTASAEYETKTNPF